MCPNSCVRGQTRYDPLSSCLVDFKGRATAASVKNYQLIKSAPEDADAKQVYFSDQGQCHQSGPFDNYRTPRPV
jgi:hypothetical protein